MKTVRFYDLMADVLENGEYTTRQLSDEFSVDLPEDFDLDFAFDILSEKTGQDVCSFSYQNINS